MTALWLTTRPGPVEELELMAARAGAGELPSSASSILDTPARAD